MVKMTTVKIARLSEKLPILLKQSVAFCDSVSSQPFLLLHSLHCCFIKGCFYRISMESVVTVDDSFLRFRLPHSLYRIPESADQN